MPLRFTTVPPTAVCQGVWLQFFEVEVEFGVPLQPRKTVCFFLIFPRLTLRAISRQLLCNQVGPSALRMRARLIITIAITTDMLGQQLLHELPRLHQASSKAF